jgi:hypothetical protein
MPSTPTQDQTQILPQSSTLLQDQVNQQDIDDVTQSIPVESAPHSFLKPSNNGDGGWTRDSMAELEKELGLALEEQVKSSSASARTSSSPRSVKAPQDEIQSRERSETTSSRLEAPRDPGATAPLLPPALPPITSSPVFLQPPEPPVSPTPQGPELGNHVDKYTNANITSEIPQSEDSDRSHKANDDDEDDEDPRPAKRRKLPPTPTHNALTPPDEPTPVDNNHHHTRRTS